MSTRARVTIAGAIAAAALIGIAAIVVSRFRDHDGTAAFRFAPVSAAVAPFDEFSEARVTVGDRCLRVLLARTQEQRRQGLRGVRRLAPYEGMLFVFPSDSDARFTMAGTPLALDITWFGSDGLPVDRARMQPCLRRPEASCPAYASRRRYRYALEQRAGQPGSGPLGGCSA